MITLPTLVLGKPIILATERIPLLERQYILIISPLVKFLSGVTFATLQTTGGAVATSGGSSNINGSDYGVLVQEADGTVVYDSRKFTTGFELITIYDAGAFTGGSREHYAAGGGTFATYQTAGAIVGSFFKTLKE